VSALRPFGSTRALPVASGGGGGKRVILLLVLQSMSELETLLKPGTGVLSAITANEEAMSNFRDQRVFLSIVYLLDVILLRWSNQELHQGLVLLSTPYLHRWPSPRLLQRVRRNAIRGSQLVIASSIDVAFPL
ncbi:unnamed protein product, partial [Cyprideis torosa]